MKIAFILRFLEDYKGAFGATTTGTWDNIDGADNT